MGEIITVNKAEVNLWLENPRFGTSANQDEAQEKIRGTPGFTALVQSIEEFGFQENNLPTVKSDTDGHYIAVDGNRRVTALKQIDDIQDIRVYLEDDQNAINAILDREHGKSRAATLRWRSVQNARYYKARYKQGLLDEIPKDVQALCILEKSLGEALPENFPLTTFVRLMGDDFASDFEISISDTAEAEVGKAELVVEIFKDIEDDSINSRNLNTESNIESYLSDLFGGKSQDERTNLRDDNDDEFDDREDAGNRLLTTAQLDELEKVLKNKRFVKELRNAPLRKYPHLLRLATRAILDTLYNIEKRKRAKPAACHSDHFKNFDCVKDTPNVGRSKSLVDRLGQFAHRVDTQTISKEVHGNDRDLVKELLDEFIQIIQK